MPAQDVSRAGALGGDAPKHVVGSSSITESLCHCTSTSLLDRLMRQRGNLQTQKHDWQQHLRGKLPDGEHLNGRQEDTETSVES